MAAATEIYVDPSIAGNSGSGTSGDPYGDLQYALDQVTRDSTNGDRFNVKAGTDEILAAALNISTYGTPSVSAQLTFQGYTSAAADGGIGGIDGNATYSVWSNGTADYIKFKDMHLHNCGANPVLTADRYFYIIDCEIENATGSGIVCSVDSLILNNYIHNIGGSYGIDLTGRGLVAHNIIEDETNGIATYAIRTADLAIVFNNIISLKSGSSAGGVQAVNNDSKIFGNSIFAVSGTGRGISVESFRGFIFNNIAEGFSGVGGVGMHFGSATNAYAMLENAVYNCTTDYTGSSVNKWAYVTGNESLGASPFNDPTNGDFTVDTTVKATAWPDSNNGLGYRTYLDKGALQREEPAGAGASGQMGGGLARGLGGVTA